MQAGAAVPERPDRRRTKGDAWDVGLRTGRRARAGRLAAGARCEAGPAVSRPRLAAWSRWLEPLPGSAWPRPQPPLAAPPRAVMAPPRAPSMFPWATGRPASFTAATAGR